MKFPSPADLTRIRKQATEDEAFEKKLMIVAEKHSRLPANYVKEAREIVNQLPAMLEEEAKTKWYLKMEISNLEIGNIVKDFIDAFGIVGYRIQVADEKDKKTLRIMW